MILSILFQPKFFLESISPFNNLFLTRKIKQSFAVKQSYIRKKRFFFQESL
jgi:hypothetical protein